jgi:hypothetical protein
MPAWKRIVGKGLNAPDFEEYVQTIQLTAWRPQFIVLHNTFIPRLADWRQVAGEQRMQSLQHYNRDTQHWSAGPHLFIADDLIWVFTPLDAPGVHSPFWDAISWEVELVGDYSNEDLSAEVQGNATRALAALYGLAGIAADALRLHREDPQTTHKDCPGTKVLKNDVITMVTACFAGKVPASTFPVPLLNRHVRIY